jgi:hypothetical protein
MEPVRDELGERVRVAGDLPAALVERVVAAALSEAPAQPSRLGDWPAAVACVAACLAAVVGLAVWWCGRQPAAPAGVYRAEAVAAAAASASPLPAPIHRDPSPVPARAAGTFRVEAQRSVAPSPVLQVRTTDGASLILSTNVADEALPAGTVLVVGGGDQR